MPVLTINGNKVTVDDSFLQLTPEQQDETVDEIARALPSPPPPQRQPAASFTFGQDTAPDSWGHLPAILPVQFNTKTGQPRLVVPTLLSDLWDAASLPGEVLSGQTPFDPRVPMDSQDPRTLDRASILATIFAGRPPMKETGMLPSAVSDMVGPAGKAMPPMIAGALDQANITPATLGPRLAQMGPGAVIGDLTPQLQARVGAVATTPGPGQDMIVEAMRARQLGANQRIKTQVGEIFGAEPIPSQVKAEMDALRMKANEAYPPVFREPQADALRLYDSAPVIAAIDEQIPNFVGATRAKLSAVRNMLLNPTTGQPVTNPQVVLAVRQELDGMIGELADQAGNKTTLKALSDLRKLLDRDLAAQVPGIKAADAGHAAVRAEQEAFDLGNEVLSGGDNAMHPADLDTMIAGMSGRGPTRLSQGTLATIYRLIGTTANDRVALKSILKGEGSWNREKLVSIFGQAKADKLIDLLSNEAIMQGTEQLAIGQSKTSVLQSAKENIDPARTKPGVVHSLLNLKPGDAASIIKDRIASGFFRNAAQKRNAEYAAALLSGVGSYTPGSPTGRFLVKVLKSVGIPGPVANALLLGTAQSNVGLGLGQLLTHGPAHVVLDRDHT